MIVQAGTVEVQTEAFWQNAAAILHDFAFTGVGLGQRSAHDVYEAYMLAVGPTFSHAHNAFIQAYLEQGLLGCVGLVSLALVLVFGAASLVLHDIRFLMAKPTLIYLILTVMMLKRGWMLRYMPAVAIGHGEGPMIVFGYVWAGLMALTGAANLVVAVRFPDIWPAFLAIFPTTSKMVLFAVQFATVRHLTIRSVRAQRALSPAEEA